MSALAETRPVSATAKAPTPGAAAPAPRTTATALALSAALALLILQAAGPRQAALFLLGLAMGLTLYHASFGFTAAWRAFLVHGRGAGLRAQMLMLALASLLVMPAVAEGSLFGREVYGAIAPVGVSVLVGAFLFGLGMQLAGGCGSGTLFTAGGGNPRMMVVLLFFVVGSLVGTLHLPWWLARPSLGAVALSTRLGLLPAIALQLAALAAVALLTARIESRRHGRLEHGDPTAPRRAGLRRLVQGPWPLLAGAVLLALLNWATVAVAGHTWSVTFAFGLWGAKAASAAGLDVASWEYWTWPFPAQALSASVLADTVSVMNFGILSGAFLAAGLAGRFAPSLGIALGPLVAAVLGGLLMGYGARLAFGCNIGAFFSGVASGSLHGWLWFAAALAGSALGIRLRPFMGLEPAR
ncbi:MAG: YeeE/YedE family protein [Proteobacteria bacterium]|nr:YeeE/YedE family protein [Pseudomonadota bacterium]